MANRSTRLGFALGAIACAVLLAYGFYLQYHDGQNPCPLCLAQPTVSVQVKKLSESLGLPLLESSGRKVVLTEAGREVYETVQVLFRFFIAADERLEALRKLRGVAPPRNEPVGTGLVGETGAG